MALIIFAYLKANFSPKHMHISVALSSKKAFLKTHYDLACIYKALNFECWALIKGSILKECQFPPILSSKEGFVSLVEYQSLAGKQQACQYQLTGCSRDQAAANQDRDRLLAQIDQLQAAAKSHQVRQRQFNLFLRKFLCYTYNKIVKIMNRS